MLGHLSFALAFSQVEMFKSGAGEAVKGTQRLTSTEDGWEACRGGHRGPFKVPSGGISVGHTDFAAGAGGEGHNLSNDVSWQRPRQRPGDDGARGATTCCSRSQCDLRQGEATHH